MDKPRRRRKKDERAPDPPGPEPRLSLPSSGLAEDILALADIDPALAPKAGAPSDVPLPPSRLSFLAIPTAEERKVAEATEHLATFFLAGEEYGVDVRLVQEIIRVGDVTPVPRAPRFIKGVINLRGRVIPVIDLKRKLDLGGVQPSRQARIVVVRVAGRLLGLLVDGASQVLKVPVSVIEPAPEEVVEIDANAIRGVAKLEKRLIILVDLHTLLARELSEGAGA